MGDFTPLLKQALKASGCYFVRQGKGERIGVILPIADYQAIIDELERLAAIAENRTDNDKELDTKHIYR